MTNIRGRTIKGAKEEPPKQDTKPDEIAKALEAVGKMNADGLVYISQTIAETLAEANKDKEPMKWTFDVVPETDKSSIRYGLIKRVIATQVG